MRELQFDSPTDRQPRRTERPRADERPAFFNTPAEKREAEKRAGLRPTKPAGPLIWRTTGGGF